MTVLYIGRFQPFHLGHLDAVKQILANTPRRREIKTIIIGIGSAQDNISAKNPFTTTERKKMIQAVLGKKIKIIPIPDIGDDAKWVKHVETLAPRFDVIYTGSSKVKKLFKKAGYTVCPLKFNLKISATKIRKWMREGKNWEKLVPEKVAVLLKKWDARDRLNEIQ